MMMMMMVVVVVVVDDKLKVGFGERKSWLMNDG